MIEIEIENELHDKGYNLIACIDEVGRGCLAGDVLACAVIMPKGIMIPEVNDSKKLSPKKREELYEKIVDKAIAIGIGRIGPETIDKINIKESTRLAMKEAALNLIDKNDNIITPDYLLIDGYSWPGITIEHQGVIGGDALSLSIAAASIFAKVTRDQMMIKADKLFPGYGV